MSGLVLGLFDVFMLASENTSATSIDMRIFNMIFASKTLLSFFFTSSMAFPNNNNNNNHEIR